MSAAPNDRAMLGTASRSYAGGGNVCAVSPQRHDNLPAAPACAA